MHPKAGRGLRLKLRLEGSPELIGLPWECLYDPDRKVFFALDVETPVVRYLAVTSQACPVEAPIPARVLILTANVQDAQNLKVEEEFQEISKALSPLGSRVKIERLDRPALAELEERLGRCHVFHFIGHGSTGGLLLEGRDGRPRTVDVYDLAAIFPGHHSIRLAFLNTCQGARTSGEDAFSGVAQTLLQKGVPAVVAMRHDIDDEAATLFSARFYQSLARGNSVEEAVTRARKAIAPDCGHAWAIPAVYLGQDVKVLPRPRPKWPWIVALVAIVLILGTFARTWIPRLISSYECPSPPGLGMRFVKIPAGSFLMGSKKRPGIDQIHRVTLSHAFCMGETEVTQAQWKAVAHENPSAVKGDDLPVESVSWLDAQTFLKKLNEMDRSGHYRLATEAQWEYAASGGGLDIFGYGNDEKKLREYGSCDKAGSLSPVGTFRPTHWGLHDMHGNVAEWTADLEQYTDLPVVDPVGPPRSDGLGVRGGSFKDRPNECRAAHRDVKPPETRSPWIGFRVVRDPVH